MIRRPPRSTLFPTRRSSDLFARDFFFAGAAFLATTFLPFLAAAFALPFGAAFFAAFLDRKSTRLNSSHVEISYAVFCLKKKKKKKITTLHHDQAYIYLYVTF